MSSTLIATLRRYLEAAREATDRFVAAMGRLTPGVFRAGRADGPGSDSRDRRRLGAAQFVWMSVVLGLLVALDMWSARGYFVLSCLGLLANRILFAPDDRTQLWWRAANGVTWLCLVALAYLLVPRAQ